MTTSATAREEFVDVAGLRLHVAVTGSGGPIVVLHQDIGSPGIHDPFVQELAQTNTVYLPTHPGFDKQDVPEWARHPRDLAVLHLWALRDLGLSSITLCGLGFGGWIAAEMATMAHQLIGKLALVGAAGIQPPEGDEIMDQFVFSATEYIRAGFADQSHFDRLFQEEPDVDQLEIWEINREMTTRVAWKPYMFSLPLARLVGGIKASTLLVWGEDDHIVPLSAGRRYQSLIPGSRLEVIPGCGHFVEYEKPAELAKLVAAL